MCSVIFETFNEINFNEVVQCWKSATNPSLDPGLHHPRPGVFHAGPLQHHLRPQHRPPTQLRDHAYAAQGPGILLT